MANTYYDSQLTAAEIEAVLEAIKGIIIPANNGKVLAINNGKIEARSVQWGGDSGTIVITENGFYNISGYANATVNVAGGGSSDIDTSYLPNSIAGNILASSDFTMFDGYSTLGKLYYLTIPATSTVRSSLDNDRILLPYGVGLGYSLGDIDKDITVYCVGGRIDTSYEATIIAVAYNYYGGETPNFYINGGTYAVEATVYGSNVRMNVTSDVDHVYTIAINNDTKKCRFFIDGEFKTEISFSHSGNRVCFGFGHNSNERFDHNAYFRYGAVVSGVESDATIIANQQVIMQKLGIST